MPSWRLLLCLWLLAPACATGTSAGDDSDGDGDDGVVLPDAAGSPDAEICAAQPCSLLDQCGCGTTQVCDLDGDQLATGGTECRDVTAPGSDLANCSTSTECAGGYVCLGSPGQCRRYCDGEAEGSCGEGGHCIIQIVYDAGGGTFEPVPGAVTCSKPCAPEKASDNGCPASPQFGCRLMYDDPDDVADSGDEYFLTDCSRAPDAGGGDEAPCETGSNCAPGFGCVTFGDTSVCKQTCVYNVDGAPGPRVCAAGTCQAFIDTPMVDGAEYGYCDQ